MQADEVDKIIEEALRKEGHSGGGRRKYHRTNQDRKKAIRNILNAVFLIGCVVTILVRILCPENKILFFCVGFGSVLIKIIEFIIRLML